MATWPSTLYGYILKEGYSETLPDNVLRTSMDKGQPDKIRRRSTANVRIFRCSMFFNATKMALFETFYNTTTLSGSDWFDWRHPKTQDIISTARFVGVPTYASRGSGTVVSMTIEAMP